MIRRFQYLFALFFRTFRLKLQWYRNVHFVGIQNISLTTRIYGRSNGIVKLGKKIKTANNTVIVSVGGNLNVGDYTFIGNGCNIVCHEKISIGANCMFGPACMVYDHDHVVEYEGIVTGEFKTSPIVIEDNCWIGAGSIILRGTHIGEGTVIGAGSVIKGYIPAHSVVTVEKKIKIRELKNGK